MSFEEGRRKRIDDLTAAIMGCQHPDLRCSVFNDVDAKRIAYAIQELISVNFLGHMADLHVPTRSATGDSHG